MKQRHLGSLAILLAFATSSATADIVGTGGESDSDDSETLATNSTESTGDDIVGTGGDGASADGLSWWEQLLFTLGGGDDSDDG